MKYMKQISFIKGLKRFDSKFCRCQELGIAGLRGTFTEIHGEEGQKDKQGEGIRQERSSSVQSPVEKPLTCDSNRSQHTARKIVQ